TTIAGLARLRGVSRIDFLLDGDEVYLNEVNTIPGSLAKYLWEQPFADLLDGMIAEARERPTTAWTTDGADGTALRAAGTIASKLGPRPMPLAVSAIGAPRPGIVPPVTSVLFDHGCNLEHTTMSNL